MLSSIFNISKGFFLWLFCFFFHHTVSHTNTHTVQIVLKTWLPRIPHFLGLELEHSLHTNRSLSDDEAI